MCLIMSNPIVCYLTVMEGFVVDASVASVAKRKRQTHEDDVVAKVVELSRQIGTQAATRKLNATLPPGDHLLESTARKWLSRWKKEGAFWEKQNKRGRPSVLAAVPGAKAECDRQLDALRAQGSAVTGRVAAVVARAVMEDKAPSLLERHGGVAKFSIATGSRMIAADSKLYRKKTSSRIIPAVEDVAKARDTFYSSIAECFPDGPPDESLVINFDQTFHLYNPNRGYTWEKRGATRVQLTESKDGFTLLPVVAMTGAIGAQLIFGGKTDNVLPRAPPGPFLRFTHTESHWSDEATTIALWQDLIIPYVTSRRSALSDPMAPTLVLADAYKAHWTPKVLELVARQNNIFYIGVPESLTHWLQPLDLGIIAALKHSIQRRKDEYLEKELAVALRENRTVLLSKSRPVLQENLTMWIKEAVADPVICAQRCCRSGFERAGIARVLFGDDAPVDVDSVVAAVVCDDCGEPGLFRSDLPQCEHYGVHDVAKLCSGCYTNHTTVCQI